MYNNTIKVYPNPTTGRLTVEYTSTGSGTVQIVIYDFTGKQILRKAGIAKKGINSYQFGLENLSQGIYYLELDNAAQHGRVKFVIQR